MIFVYAIYSKNFNRIYVGQSENVEKRLKEHNSGQTKSIKAYIPWELFYQEECSDRIEARKKEIYYKSGVGKEKLKLLLSQNF
ncbi:MAG: GIY-YIG nuclease family protein [Bacteroidota bacterium]